MVSWLIGWAGLVVGFAIGWTAKTMMARAVAETRRVDDGQWRIDRAMETCCASGPLGCGLRQCHVGKPCGHANEIHDAMLDAEQRTTARPPP